MPGIVLDHVCQFLAALAPLKLAESWDNVGLLVGDRSGDIHRMMTCLTVTPNVVDEAIERDAELVIAHHPLPFRPVQRITSDSIPGDMLWRLMQKGIALYSAHTAFDSATHGVNQTWAESLKLNDIRSLNPPEPGNELGSGRYGELDVATSAREIILSCADFASAAGSIRGVGPLDKVVSKVAFACGSGGSFVPAAVRRGCDLLITGEATFHDCLAAESSGIAMGLLGHYHSERFAMENLARVLATQWPDLSVWPSESEHDPVQVIR